MPSEKQAKVLDELKKLKEALETKSGLEDHPALRVAEEAGPEYLESVAQTLHTLLSVLDDGITNIEQASDLDNEGGLNLGDLEDIALLASELEKEPGLQKHANVLEQLLITFADKVDLERIKQAQEDELNKLWAKYRQEDGDAAYTKPKEVHAEQEGRKEADKAIKETFKEYTPLEAPLSMRHCPDHPGVMVGRIGDGVWQCPMDKKTYSYVDGFTTEKGGKVPGGTVQEQNAGVYQSGMNGIADINNFSTRDGLMQNKN